MSKNTQTESFGRFDFVGNIGIFGAISTFLIVGSFIFLAIKGISYGIDFKGGTEMQVKFNQTVSIDQIRKTAEGLDLGEVGVQGFGEGNEYIIRFGSKKDVSEKDINANMNASVIRLRDAINTEYATQGPDIRRVDTVGPQVGAELKRNGFLAVFYCLLVIMIYVSLRFDYKYSPGAVVCLLHDVVITLAIFIMLGKEVNVPILAALLSLIGFSLNDTIVVFDRIRETEAEHRDKGTGFIINKAINDMLGRTFITAGSLALTSLCLYLFAGGVVSDIAFVITVGLFFGTYSSIYVAAPLILLVEKMKAPKAA